MNEIILNLVFMITGMLAGYAFREQQKADQYNKTYKEIDADLKKQLELYKNLSESYKEDTIRYKAEIKKLKSH
jgi:hypothetical protein